MIEISVRKDGITIAGHAGYAPAGKDIVCAGVSALVQTLIVGMEALTGDSVHYGMSPGKAVISYGNLSEAGRLLVDSFFLGTCRIADEYPEHVRIR